MGVRSTVTQIIACGVILVLSKHEKPYKPLRAWVVVRSVASLSLGYCNDRYLDEFCTQLTRQNLLGNTTWNSRSIQRVACFKLALECFLLAWVAVGCVWLFSGTSSRPVAPLLYWLSFVITMLHIVTYVIFFMACAAICCFLASIVAAIFFACVAAIMAIRDNTDEAAMMAVRDTDETSPTPSSIESID